MSVGKSRGTRYVRGMTYRLDLARVDADDPNAGSDELLSQALGEAADGGLGGTVDGAADVGLASCGVKVVSTWLVLARGQREALTYQQWSQC
jgi:hypothetical protein